MTPKDHPVWNKMAVQTLDTLEEVFTELYAFECLIGNYNTASLRQEALVSTAFETSSQQSQNLNIVHLQSENTKMSDGGTRKSSI